MSAEWASYHLSDGTWHRRGRRTWVGVFPGATISIRLPRCIGPGPLAIDGAAYRRRARSRG